MECDIKITINGNTQILHSDEALDAYLFKHRDALLQRSNGKIDPTLSIDEDTVTRLKALKSGKFATTPTKNVRTTTLWKYFEDSTLEEFDEESYREKFIKEYLIDNPTKARIEAIKAFEEWREKPANLGTDVHYGLQAHFDKSVTINSSNLHTLSAAEVISIGNNIGRKLDAIFDKTYGKGNWKTFSEFSMFTENIDESKLRELNANLRAQNPNHEDVTKISGTTDLIVVDKDGAIHLYDFKTSKRSFSKWLPNKKKATALQLETYAAILKQLGFNVKTTNVVVIDVDVDRNTASFDSVESLPFDRKIYSLVNQVIPNQIEVEIDDLKAVNDIMRTLFPNGNVDTIAARKAVDVEQYKKKVYPVNPESDLAKRPDFLNAKFYFKNELTGKYIPCKSEEDIDEKIASYVNDLNEARSKELLLFGRRLANWIKSKDLNALKKYTSDERGPVQDHLQFQFRKYIVNGWNLVENDVLFENGILLFEKNGRIEIVMTDILDLNTLIPLKNGKSILGTVRGDTDITDNRKILDSRRGHMLLMKAMAFISENQDIFKNKKIQNIKAINLHNVETLTASNSTLQLNWKLLSASFLKLKLPIFGNKTFMKDENSFLHQANDYVLSFEYLGLSQSAMGLSFRESEYLQDFNRDFTRSELLKFIKDYQRDLHLYRLEGMSTTGDWKMPALNMLLQAYLSTFDVSINAQEDLGTIWSGKKGFAGTEIAPFGTSSSGTLRSLEEVNSLFERNVEQQFKQVVTPWQLLLKKIYDNPNSRYSSLSGSSKFFESWFVTDSDGSINEQFMLKDPSELDESEAPLCQMFLDTLAELRGLNTPEKIQKAKLNGTYYEVPLIKGRLFESIRHQGGIKNTLQTAVDRIAKWDFEQALGLSLTKGQREKLDDLSILKLDNYLLEDNPKHRQELITDNGIANYSTDLDLIFLTTVAFSIRSKLSEYYIPALTAFRVFLEMEDAINSSNPNSNTKKAVTDWMKSVVYGKSLMDPHNMFWVKLSAMLKSATSTITLGLSTTAFTREGLTSTIINFINSQNGLDPDIDAKTLANAYMDMTEGLRSTTDITSKDQQFNTLFGVAEMSFEQMAKSNRTNPYGFGNIDGDIFYVTSTSMDYYHRNAIVKTKLMKRGAYDAYSLDENGALVYDFDKDEQWNLIRKYKTVQECPKDQRNEWFKQMDRYENSIRSWNKLEGYNLQKGDKLPQALNPDELDGLRIFVNLLHGFYDNSQKVLMQKQLLGGLFMQYKTVPLARLQMQNHPTGSINVTDRRPIKDVETGKQMYEVINEEDISIGFMVEGEEGLDELIEKGLARPAYVSMGNPLVGKVEETLDVVGTIIKCAKDGDFTALQQHYNDPFKRRTLFIAMWDLLGMSLVSFLINAAFGDTEDNIKEVSAIKRWAWTVLTGVAQEGPIWSVAKSIVGDGTLPLVTTLGRYSDTAWSVITGRTPVLYGIMNTFGATRPLSNLVYE